MLGHVLSFSTIMHCFVSLLPAPTSPRNALSYFFWPGSTVVVYKDVSSGGSGKEQSEVRILGKLKCWSIFCFHKVASITLEIYLHLLTLGRDV